MKRLVLSLLATMAGVVAGARTIETSFVLTEDADWSDENLEIPSGVTVDLNGHRLAVSTVSGGGTLTDSRRYVALDYVKSTGQQYVKTGYTPGTNTTASLDFTSGAYVSSTVYFGCVWKTQAWMLGLANDSFYFFSGAISVCGFAAERHLRFQIDKKASTSGWARMYDAETNVRLGETSVNLENVNDEKELCVFGTPKGSCSRFSLHAFKVWEAGELVRDYVPARDPDTGRVGLLDRVSGVLSSSDSATALVAGSDVGTVSSVGQVRLVGTTDFPFAQFAGAIPAHLRMTLASDADWSATPTATLAGKLDLEGHVLTVASLAGAGEITDSRRYVALEYAESTGGQRVRTGYVPGVDTQVSLDFVPLSERNKSRFFIGSKWATYSWSFGQTSQSPGFFCFFGGGLNWGDTVTGRRFGLNIDADKKRMTLTDLENGVVYTQQTDLDLKNANGDEMLVFGGNTDDLCGAMRFYSLKISEGGVRGAT